MGRVKAWLMSMEDDACVLTLKEFIEKWGRAHATIWFEQNEKMENENVVH